MGGVGEIGSNMTLIETPNNIIVIDYGILFPYDDFFDINYLIVDTTYLEQTDKKITLFITHGHEDHIGAVHHLVKKFPEMEILTPSFPYQLLKQRFEQKKMSLKAKIYKEDDSFSFEFIKISPVHVTHSIPQTFGVIIEAKELETAILFISDFKYDLQPFNEKPFNTNKIKESFGTYKRRIAFLDSTNILKAGKTQSESELIKSFEELLKENKRTFITQFASNLNRMIIILDAAKKHKKKVTMIGRSFSKYIEAAQEAELFNRADFPIIEFESVQNYNDPKVIYIVTGSQGEHLGALQRIARNEQKNIEVKEGDRFIFSSKPIPGNEDKVYRIYNQLTNLGADLITFQDKLVHASGHPAQEDLKALITAIKPTHIIPIHGESYFLKKHKEFIKMNFPLIESYFLQNHDGIEISENEIKIFKNDAHEPLLIHGNDLIIEKAKISERRKLACNGLVVISFNHAKENYTVTTQGLPLSAEESMLKLKDYISYTFYSELKKRDYEYKQEQVRIKVRNFYHDLLGYKPIVIVHTV